MQKTVNVLLVDDDVDDSSLFKEVLLGVYPNANFRSAVDGSDAIDMLENERSYIPDIIFLDLNMPRMDGKECLKILKADQSLKAIPVIIYTTSSQSRDIEETMISGASCFITKPTHLQELREILKAIMGNLGADINKILSTLSKAASGYIVC